MIIYERGGCTSIFLKVFQCKGSVFPISFGIALPCALVTAGLRAAMDAGYILPLIENEGRRILQDNSVWSSFTFLVGFLVVFRTSQAYARFWDGCTSTHQMRAEWYDACSALFAFCKDSKAPDLEKLKFQHLIVRLFSMLHAVALADIEDTSKGEDAEVAAFRYELVDGGGLDRESLKAIKQSDAKVELVFQWIQQVIVENIGTGVLSIPAPILSRSFQEIANGMVAFHEAIKISTIPFPFPYAQVCECLLLMHWVATPMVVAQFVETPWWGAVFTFITVFVPWSLNAIAIEIENPFGMDANDIDAAAMQTEMNRHLLLLLEPQTRKTPQLHPAFMATIALEAGEDDMSCFQKPTFQTKNSLMEIWEDIDEANAEHTLPAHTCKPRFGTVLHNHGHGNHRLSGNHRTSGSHRISSRAAKVSTSSCQARPHGGSQFGKTLGSQHHAQEGGNNRVSMVSAGAFWSEQEEHSHGAAHAPPRPDVTFAPDADGSQLASPPVPAEYTGSKSILVPSSSPASASEKLSRQLRFQPDWEGHDAKAQGFPQLRSPRGASRRKGDAGGSRSGTENEDAVSADPPWAAPLQSRSPSGKDGGGSASDGCVSISTCTGAI